jgi:predicted PolB exonuclease-like 3'-5' exonuclease
MLNNIVLENILIIDIETVPCYPEYDVMPAGLQKLWDHKAEWIKKGDDDTPASLYERAGIYAEFGKVVCISAGFLKGQEFRLKSFYGEEEKPILEEFATLLKTYFNRPDKQLCAHNGKEFDFPFLARRMMINGLRIPEILDTSGRKPWETKHLDTMELWKFGDHKNYVSLDLLTAILDIPTPKDDITGADIYRIYWKDHDLPRIVKYCRKDVIAVAQVLMRFREEEAIPDDKIIFVDN